MRQRRQQLLAKRDSTPTSTPRGTGSGLASETPTREAAAPADDHQARESEDVRVGHSLLELAAGADPRLVASASAAAVSFAATSSAKEASLPSTDLGGEGTEARRLYSYMRRAGHPITPHKVKRLLRKFDGRTGELFARLEQKFGVAEADPAATGAAEDERLSAHPLLSSAAAFAAALDHALGAARSAAHAAVAAAERAGANAHDEVFLTAAYKRLAVTLLGKSARNWEQLETVWRIYATASEEGNEGGIDAAAVRWERGRDVGRAKFCSQLYIICLALFPHPRTHTHSSSLRCSCSRFNLLTSLVLFHRSARARSGRSTSSSRAKGRGISPSCARVVCRAPRMSCRAMRFWAFDPSSIYSRG